MSAVATALLFGLAASGATLAGGLLAMRLRNRTALLFGLCAGIVIGVAVFDLIPEAFALQGTNGNGAGLLGFVALGFGAFLILNRDSHEQVGRRGWRMHLGPLTLTLHSLLDGMGIGIAFQIDQSIGATVALAVLTHDLADGVNIVGLCLAARSDRAARVWLTVNGLAPFLGVLLGLQVVVPAAMLAPLLGIVAGVFLYIGVWELIPRSLRIDPRARTVAAILTGAALVLAASQVVR